jgi:hypothetical protein
VTCWRGAGEPDPDVTERGPLKYAPGGPVPNPLDVLEARLVALYDSREGRDVAGHQPGLNLALHELRKLQDEYEEMLRDARTAQRIADEEGRHIEF